MKKKNITKAESQVEEGYIRMMDKAYIDGVVQYQFHTVTYKDENLGIKSSKSSPSIINKWELNPIIGKKFHLTFTGRIRCVDCGRITKKSFNQGSCYVCFTSLASNDICILKPTLCHHHKGTCREPEWGTMNCFSKHTVYLSVTSDGKVGITKEKYPIHRWIDQGAILAIPILETNSRYEAGIIEEFIAKYIPDKSNWQKMVTGEPDLKNYDLKKERKKFLKALEGNRLIFANVNEKQSCISFKEIDSDETRIQYPIQSYPKAKSIKVEISKPLGGTLIGIKGQYLLFDTGVINIRNLQGYEVDWKIG